MLSIVFLVAAVVFFLPVFIIVQLSSLRAEVLQLRRRLELLEGTKNVTQVSPLVEAPASIYQPVPVQAELVQVQSVAPVSFTPAPEHRAVSNAPAWWSSQDAFTKVGAVLVLMAFGWFVSYAITSGWIGPVGQIALGLIAGVGTLGFGLYRMERHAAQGAIFVALGTAIILLSIFAGRYVYDFFTPVSATLVMLGAVATSAFASVRYLREQLAVATLCMAGSIPALAHTASPDAFSLFTFLLIVVCGTIIVATVVGSRVLVSLALGIVFVWGLPYLDGSYLTSDQSLIFGFASLFAFIFTAANVFCLLKERTIDYTSYAVTAVLTASYTLLWINVAAPAEFHVPLYLTWAVLYAFGSWVIARSTKQPMVAHIYLGVAGVFIAIATAKVFDGPLLIVAAMGEITVVLLVLLRVFARVHVAKVVAFLYAIPALLSLQQMTSSAWQSGFLHIDFFVLAAMTVTFFAMAIQFHAHEDREEEISAAAVLIVSGAVYSVLIIWLVLHATVGGVVATALALIIYTVISLGLYIGGMTTDDVFARTLGMVGMGGVVARLLLVEVWALPLGLRIVAFLVIGLLLLSTAFVTKGKKTYLPSIKSSE